MRYTDPENQTSRSYPQRYLTVFFGIWIGFLCFGSWYPFELDFRGFGHVLDRWLNAWLSNSEGIDNIENLLLGIPTGFLSVHLIGGDCKRSNEKKSILYRLSFIVVFLFLTTVVAIVVELGQGVFVGRFSSLRDSALQVLGGFLGLIIAISFYDKTRTNLFWLHTRFAQMKRLDLIFLAIGVSYVVFQLWPGIPGISPSEISEKIRGFKHGIDMLGKDTISCLLSGIQSESMVFLAFSFSLMFSFGVLCFAVVKSRNWSFFTVAFLVLLTIFLIEVMKIGFDRRMPSIANFSLASVGFALGCLCTFLQQCLRIGVR